MRAEVPHRFSRGLALVACALSLDASPALGQLVWQHGDIDLTLAPRFVGEVASANGRLGPGEGFTMWAVPKVTENRGLAAVSGRQSGMGFIVEGPLAKDFTVRGVVDFNLMGSNPGARAAGAFFTRAYAEVRNDDWRFAFGRTASVVTPLSASTLNWSGIEQGGDMNSSAPRDVMIVERRFDGGATFDWTLQGAISDPESAFLVEQANRIAEDDGIPNFEGRLAAAIGAAGVDDHRPLEIGVSGLAGRLRAENDSIRIVDNTWASRGTITAQSRSVRHALGTIRMLRNVLSYNECRGRDLNPQGRYARGILSPLCLPISPPRRGDPSYVPATSGRKGRSPVRGCRRRRSRDAFSPYDPLSKTTRHRPSESLRQMELNLPAASPSAPTTGPELMAKFPDSSTWTRSGPHENGGVPPSKNGRHASSTASTPRSGSFPLKNTASGATKERKASRSLSAIVLAKATSRARTSSTAGPSNCPLAAVVPSAVSAAHVSTPPKTALELMDSPWFVGPGPRRLEYARPIRWPCFVRRRLRK